MNTYNTQFTLGSRPLIFILFALIHFSPICSAADSQITKCSDWTASVADADKPSANALCKQLAAMANVKQGVPDAPAFAILGITPENVVRPKTPEDIVANILNARDQDGNQQVGLAMDFVPYTLLAGTQVTLENYQSSYLVRFLSRTQTSVAMAKGTDNNDKAERLAFGLRFTPWLRNDPRQDKELLDCLIDETKDSLASVTPPPPAGKEEQNNAYREEVTKAYGVGRTKCQTTYEKRAWDSSGWTLGLSPTWRWNKAGDSSTDFDGFAAWTSLSLHVGAPVPGLNDLGLLTIHMRYRLKETISDESLPVEDDEQDSILIAGAFQFGKPAFNASLEGGYVDVWRDKNVDDKFGRFAAAINYRVLESDYWLKASIGSTSGRKLGDEATFNLSINYGNNILPLVK